MALQLAKSICAKVATTISSVEKRMLVEDLGADLVVNYREADFVEAAKDWNRGQGLDAAFDNVGGSVLRRTYDAVRPYGHVVTLMGMAPDEDGIAYNANLSVHNEMMLTPMWLGMTDRLIVQARMIREVLELMRKGAVRVRIAAEFPLERAGDAHALIETGGVAGKIVLAVRS